MCERVFAVLTLFSFIVWIYFHMLFVVDNQILKTAIETQMKGMFYRGYHSLN